MKSGRDHIIEETVKLSEKLGWNNTSIRQISKKINYSTIKVYSEFGSKDELFRQIQFRGYEMLHIQYQRAIDSCHDPEEQLIALSLAHWEFSRSYSRYYELMFQTNGVACQCPSMQVRHNTMQPVRKVLKEIHGSVDRGLFFHWVSLTQGFVVAMGSKVAIEDKEKEAMLIKMLRTFIKGIK